MNLTLHSTTLALQQLLLGLSWGTFQWNNELNSLVSQSTRLTYKDHVQKRKSINYKERRRSIVDQYEHMARYHVTRWYIYFTFFVMIYLALWHKSFIFTGFSYFLTRVQTKRNSSPTWCERYPHRYWIHKALHNWDSELSERFWHQMHQNQHSTTRHSGTLFRPVPKLLKKVGWFLKLPRVSGCDLSKCFILYFLEV